MQLTVLSPVAHVLWLGLWLRSLAVPRGAGSSSPRRANAAALKLSARMTRWMPPSRAKSVTHASLPEGRARSFGLEHEVAMSCWPFAPCAVRHCTGRWQAARHHR
eukprot:3524781-Prymnesium_polylepis.3